MKTIREFQKQKARGILRDYLFVFTFFASSVILLQLTKNYTDAKITEASFLLLIKSLSFAGIVTFIIAICRYCYLISPKKTREVQKNYKLIRDIIKKHKLEEEVLGAIRSDNTIDFLATNRIYNKIIQYIPSDMDDEIFNALFEIEKNKVS